MCKKAPFEEGQARCGHLRGRDHQHALDARQRGEQASSSTPAARQQHDHASTQQQQKGGSRTHLFSRSLSHTQSRFSCVTQDYLDALGWAKSIGGYAGLVGRANANLAVLEKFVAATPWMEFLATDATARSNTSVCLKITDLDAAGVKKMAAILEKEDVALDVGAYRSAPPGFRIWCGPTVESSDLEALLPWLEWAHAEAKA